MADIAARKYAPTPTAGPAAPQRPAVIPQINLHPKAQIKPKIKALLSFQSQDEHV